MTAIIELLMRIDSKLDLISEHLEFDEDGEEPAGS